MPCTGPVLGARFGRLPRKLRFGFGTAAAADGCTQAAVAAAGARAVAGARPWRGVAGRASSTASWAKKMSAPPAGVAGVPAGVPACVAARLVGGVAGGAAGGAAARVAMASAAAPGGVGVAAPIGPSFGELPACVLSRRASGAPLDAGMVDAGMVG